MAIVVDDGITLTLHTGDTVTLYEKNISVEERKDIRKQALVFNSLLEYKQRQAEKIDERREAIEADESLNGEREAKLAAVAAEGADLLAAVDLIELNAAALARRFESWDVFASQADKEAGRAVELTKEAIMAFCEKPKRAALIAEIAEKLIEYDRREEKNVTPAVAGSGNSSTVTPA